MRPLVSNEKKIVWVLGAGFSKPVGLPLAKDLFTKRFAALGIGFATPNVWDPTRLRERWDPRFNDCLRRNQDGKGDTIDVATISLQFQSDIRDALSPLDSLPEHDLITQHRRVFDSFAKPAHKLIKGIVASPASVELQGELKSFLKNRSDSPFSVLHPQSPLVQALDRTRAPLIDAVEAVRLSNQAGEMTAEEVLVSLEAAANGDYANQSIWTHNDPNSAVGRPRHGTTGITEYCRETLNSLTRLIVAQLEAPIPQDIQNPGYAWEPYRRWARDLLSEKDTIVTFNYDRVVETACELGNVALRRKDDDFFRGPRMLKLHGSVTHASDGAGVRDITPQELRLQLAGIEPFKVRLGLPGESKNQITRGGGHLRKSWQEAERAIAGADEIILIGYSLPPEDVQAMDMIVGSIRTRQKSEPLQIKLVLGPGEKEAKVIESILDGSGDVENTNYYTQHALNTWQRS